MIIVTTLDDVKGYLKIDCEDDDLFLLQLLDVSELYIDSMVGEGYKTDHKAVRLADILQLLIISSLYETRSLEVKEASINKIAHSILDKLSN